MGPREQSGTARIHAWFWPGRENLGPGWPGLVDVDVDVGIGIDVDGESKGQCCVTSPCSSREHITRSDHHSIPGEAGCWGEMRQVYPVLAAYGAVSGMGGHRLRYSNTE